jgi:hypothetical protein
VCGVIASFFFTYGGLKGCRKRSRRSESKCFCGVVVFYNVGRFWCLVPPTFRGVSILLFDDDLSAAFTFLFRVKVCKEHQEKDDSHNQIQKAARAEIFKVRCCALVLFLKRIEQLNVGNSAPKLKSSSFRKLAQMTEGYSGADISVLVRDAMMQVRCWFC